jgi:hypothetical protein
MSVTTFFDGLVVELESVEGASADVTLGTLTLGSREATTGWRAVTYPTSTIHMPVLPQGSTFNYMGVGLYAYENALGLTDDTVKLGDQIKTSDNRYYMIEGLQKQYWLNKFAFWKATLSEQPIWQAAPGTLTWSKTRPNDPRERTKVYIDTYVRDAQITKDNDSTQAAWACIFSDLPYPLTQEFRAASSPVQGLYVVEMPNSTPMMDVVTQAPYGYTERVPIHIVTIDSTGCTGTALNWKMEAELRYVCEQNPKGSYRLPYSSQKLDRELGGMWLYDRLFILIYERDTT